LIERVQSGSLYSRDTATGWYIYSSEKRGLCLMKCSSEMLQNLPYFWNMKTHVHSFFYSIFSPNECPGPCRRHRPGHFKEKKYSSMK